MSGSCYRPERRGRARPGVARTRVRAQKSRRPTRPMGGRRDCSKRFGFNMRSTALTPPHASFPNPSPCLATLPPLARQAGSQPRPRCSARCALILYDIGTCDKRHPRQTRRGPAQTRGRTFGTAQLHHCPGRNRDRAAPVLFCECDPTRHRAGGVHCRCQPAA